MANPPSPPPSHLLSTSTANMTGGGVYGLSTVLNVAGSRFEANFAATGAGLATDCAAEICVGQTPRDTCGSHVTNVTAESAFESNQAAFDGGGIHVRNQALVASGDTYFASNMADRGGVIFAHPTATVEVGGLTGSAINEAELSGTNRVLSYGPGVASPAATAEWTALAPLDTSAVMPGTNLCVGTCVATLVDSYGNVPTTPTVVEIVTSIPAMLAVQGPRYILVADGASAPIPDLGVSVVGDDPEVVGSGGLSGVVGLRFLDSAVLGGAVPVDIVPCGPGHGLKTSGEGASARFWCEPCPAGQFSSATDPSWAACDACLDGTETSPTATGATSCDWCDAGWGWDTGENACQVCAEGTFSAAPALEAGCDACTDRLTTDGTGATACTNAVNVGILGSSPIWLWVAIGVGVVAMVACVGACAWRYSRRKVMSHYYIGTGGC